jgi:hypothetical protein
MADAVVVAAVKAHLATWSRFAATVIDYPNEVFTTPGDGSTFVQVDFPVATSDQASLGAPGANKFRDLGTIRFIVNMQTGSGVDLANTYSGEIADLFRAKVLTSNVITYAPTPPVYLGVDGNYAAWSVSVPYKYDHQG